MIQTLLFHDHRFLDHDPGEHHPESPARIRAIIQALERSPIAGTSLATPSAASREQLERIHHRAYVDEILALDGQDRALDPDTAVSAGSVHAALLSAGAAIDAVTAVSLGRAQNAFSLARPPGHHAEPDRAMGFCLFNNVAIAAAHARAALGHQRVLIVDWDVHHGNGTQSAFYERNDVLFFSTHRLPFFPGTGALREVGAGLGEGFNVNVPLPARLGDGDYAAIFYELLLPIADAYRPDLVLVSAGFDSHEDDPLGGMGLTPDGFAHLCAVTKLIAERHAGGRLVLVLEGGYDLDGLAASVHACTRILAGGPPPPSGPPDSPGLEVIEGAKQTHGRHWKF